MKALDRTPVRIRGRRRPKIFLSHNSDDKPFVRRLAKGLNRFGIDAWLDEWELEAGDSLHESIGHALEKSRYVGIVITPAFVQSTWCIDELNQSLAREKRQGNKVVIPLLYKRAVPPPFVEDRLHLNFSKSYHVALTTLCATLHGISARKIATVLEDAKPRNFDDVHERLVEMGWDNYQLVDRSDFETVRLAASKLGINMKGDHHMFSEEQVKKILESYTKSAKVIKRLWLED